jgi:hypothetical protein
VTNDPISLSERRYFVRGSGRYLFVVPALFCCVALYALSGRSSELLIGGPILLLLSYACVVLVVGRVEMYIHPGGFRLQPGPLPAGLRAEVHAKETVRALFPRHLREADRGRVARDNYYAAVELSDGRWLNLRGPYFDWAQASAAAMELAHLWSFPEVAAGRSGFPARRDWTAALIVLFWGLAFGAALVWAIVGELTGIAR